MDPAMAMGTGPPYRAPTTKGDRSRMREWSPFVGCGSDQLKLSPQAQELPALGLSMVNPCFSIVSAKSIVAPER